MGDDDKYNEEKKAGTTKEEKPKLLSNYPNPFSGYTTLEAYLTDEVKSAYFVISDMTGSKIKTIHLMERGKTGAQFDGSLLANGTYFATLMVDGQVNGTLKMVVTH